MGALTSEVLHEVRVVHVLAPSVAGESPAMALSSYLRRLPRSEPVIVLGSELDAGRIEALGVRVAARMPWSASGSRRRWKGVGGFGVAGWRRHLDAWFGDDCLVCAWGGASAGAWNIAAGGGPRASVIIDDGEAGPDEVCAGWEDATLVVCGESSAAGWRAAGAIDVRIAPARFGVGVGTTPAWAGARAVLPEELGLGAKARVVGLLADPGVRGDARWFAFVLGLMYAAGQDVGGLIPVETTWERRGARFVRDHGRRWALRTWEESLASMARVCDALVVPPWTGRGERAETVAPLRSAAGAALLWEATATGARVIVPENAVTRELAREMPLTMARLGTPVEYGARVLEALQSGEARTAVQERGDDFARVVSEVVCERAGIRVG